MKLIAEIGSSKSNWVLIGENNLEVHFSTQGINPYFNKEDYIIAQLTNAEPLAEYISQVKDIHYYGAGGTNEHLKAIIITALQKVFLNVESISCESDLMAAALATWDGSPALISILGTGANTAFFDGEKLHYNKPALGYILGDEASGAYFGKQLLRAYFYKELPPQILAEFQKKYALTKAIAFDNIYKQPRANVYIASFMPFLIEHQDTPTINTILRKGFAAFLETHIVPFKDQSSSLHLVGSVAHFGQKILKEEAHKREINITKIVQRPINGLINYYKSS